jgi:hypothetical protein
LDKISRAQVAFGYNVEKLNRVKSHLHDMERRKITNNQNYQTDVNIARQALYSISFPDVFDSELPSTEISTVLDNF